MPNRTSELLSLTIAARNAIRRYLSPAPEIGDWSKRTHQIKQGDPLDMFTAFAIQAARRSRTVVEIGAADGRRITAIKSVLPEVRAIGLDISINCLEPKTIFGVEFRRFESGALDELVPDGSLILSVGTLACMPTTSVADIFSFVRRQNCRIVFFEPMPWFTVKRSVPRRLNGGWYHPYPAMAAQAGLSSELSETWKHLASHKTIERWEYNLLSGRPS